MQALSPVHSVTLLSSTIVDNNLDEVFDQTWAPTQNLSRQIYLTTDCTTRTDLSHHCWIIVYRTCRIYFQFTEQHYHILTFSPLQDIQQISGACGIAGEINTCMKSYSIRFFSRVTPCFWQFERAHYTQFYAST